MLGTPVGIAVDLYENVYFSDFRYNVIRMVNASSKKIFTVVGTGLAGFSGDGGLAAFAELTTPTCLALDSKGNLFLSDSGNNRIRMVNGSTRIIFTVAGSSVELGE
jgi:DNA-binding beta-propeller fold protein YncE